VAGAAATDDRQTIGTCCERLRVYAPGPLPSPGSFAPSSHHGLVRTPRSPRAARLNTRHPARVSRC